MTNLVIGALTGLALMQSADTTVQAPSGTALAIENRHGSVVVRTWDRREVRVQTQRPGEPSVEIARDGSTLRIRPAAAWRHGDHSDDDIELRLTVPESTAMSVSAPFADVDIEGTGASVAVESVEGDVWVRGAGSVAVRAAEGDIRIEGARGAVAASSGDGDIEITDAAGAVAVEGIDGDITMLDIEASSVDAVTVDGDVVYRGTIRDGGQYRLSTHDGDIVATVPESANVRVWVSTFDGDFQPSFPITLSTGLQNRFEFTIGSGSARLELEAFDGEIFLIRPGERLPDYQ